MADLGLINGKNPRVFLDRKNQGENIACSRKSMRNEDIGIECCIDVKLSIIGQIICYVDSNWSIIFLNSSISAEIEQMQVNLKDYYSSSRYALIGSKNSLVLYQRSMSGTPWEKFLQQEIT